MFLTENLVRAKLQTPQQAAGNVAAFNFLTALAKEKKAELVTGDPEFKPLEKEIKVTWLK